MISLLLAAAFTFTATATGVEKGTPLEFMFAGKNSDRDYETMFLLDESVDAFANRLEKAGLKRGTPTDYATCHLWPVGVPVSISPKLTDFVDTDMPEGLSLGPVIYTGGSRLKDNVAYPDAATNMPAAVFALYTLDQALFVFDGIYPQGQVYGAHKAKNALKKGSRQTFTVTWDDSLSPLHVDIVLEPQKLKDALVDLQKKSKSHSLDVSVGFSDELTVLEATAAAEALSAVDSVRVKINGRQPGDFFYRAFLPLVKWRDRKERLTQPFEITLGKPDRVVFIDEDWSVDGPDPKLTEKEISYQQMADHPRTDTVFFFAKKETKLKDLKAALKRLPKTVINHYVYGD